MDKLNYHGTNFHNYQSCFYHLGKLPVAVASKLTFDLGVTACGSTSGSGSLTFSVSVPIVFSAFTGDGAGAGWFST